MQWQGETAKLQSVPKAVPDRQLMDTSAQKFPQHKAGKLQTRAAPPSSTRQTTFPQDSRLRTPPHINTEHDHAARNGNGIHRSAGGHRRSPRKRRHRSGRTPRTLHERAPRAPLWRWLAILLSITRLPLVSPRNDNRMVVRHREWSSAVTSSLAIILG